MITLGLEFILPLLLTVIAGHQEPAILVRVKNDSAFSLKNIEIISPASGLVRFGDLSNGNISEYRKVSNAYRTTAIYAEIERNKVQFLPDDYLGEQHLPSGKYTFSITVSEVNGQKYLKVKFIDDGSQK